MPDELILDQLQQAHLALKKGGQCLVSAEEDIPWLMEHMKKMYGHVSLRDRNATSTLLVSQKKQDLKKIKEYRAEFTMTVPNGRSIRLVTRPGVFAHRRVDEGAQALAEVAVTQPGDVILDMGCGCGSIGLSLAVNQPTSEVVFLDSNARAIHAAELNGRINAPGRCTALLSDQGYTGEPRFTLFVGNPPYYSHDRISDLFIRTAHQALTPGGRAYIVAKQSEHNTALMKKLFGNADVLHRRGYDITRAVKS
jgi:16S rRNA (guanine1207-N2)-methyltransferase